MPFTNTTSLRSRPLVCSRTEGRIASSRRGRTLAWFRAVERRPQRRAVGQPRDRHDASTLAATVAAFVQARLRRAAAGEPRARRKQPTDAAIIRSVPADPSQANATQPVTIEPSALPAMFAVSTADAPADPARSI